nr:type IV pilus secretin PilQ [Gammaproteobacteria bacterium]
MLLASASALAQQAAERALREIDVQPLTGQRVGLRLRTDGHAPQPMSFTIDDPARIAVDLPGTSLAASRRQDVNVGPLRSIQAAEANGRTRVVLNLDTMVPYETRVEGDTILVVLGQQASGALAASTFAGQPV